MGSTYEIEPGGDFASAKNTSCSAPIGRGIGSAAAATAAVVATEQRLDLTNLKQFFSAYQLLGMETVAREMYQRIRLPVLRSLCVEFAEQSIHQKVTPSNVNVGDRTRHDLYTDSTCLCTYCSCLCNR